MGCGDRPPQKSVDHDTVEKLCSERPSVFEDQATRIAEQRGVSRTDLVAKTLRIAADSVGQSDCTAIMRTVSPDRAP